MDRFSYADAAHAHATLRTLENHSFLSNKQLFDWVTALPLTLADGSSDIESHIATQTISGRQRAVQIVSEYRRFLYLLAISDRPLALPPLLNAVCRLQFNNTSAGLRELIAPIRATVPPFVSVYSASFSVAYREMIGLYRREFGEAPFKKIWPSPIGVRIYMLWNFLVHFALVTVLISLAVLFLGGPVEILVLAGLGLILGVPMFILPSLFIGPWGLYYPGD